jgi:hypothetical protein
MALYGLYPPPPRRSTGSGASLESGLVVTARRSSCGAVSMFGNHGIYGLAGGEPVMPGPEGRGPAPLCPLARCLQAREARLRRRPGVAGPPGKA